MKKQILIIGVIIIILIVGFTGCVFQEQGFFINKQDEPSENYINITYDRLHNFPTLKKALINNILGEGISV